MNRNAVKLICKSCGWTATVPVADMFKGRRLKCQGGKQPQDCGWQAADESTHAQVLENERDNAVALANLPRN